jgi:hypothetical protein
LTDNKAPVVTFFDSRREVGTISYIQSWQLTSPLGSGVLGHYIQASAPHFIVHLSRMYKSLCSATRLRCYKALPDATLDAVSCAAKALYGRRHQ